MQIVLLACLAAALVLVPAANAQADDSADDDAGCAEASTMGDGKGGTEKKIGKYDTFAECIAAVKEEQPTANGVTWGKGKSRQCYAEFGQTSTKASTVWQNCVIAATPAETPATPATDSGTDSRTDSS